MKTVQQGNTSAKSNTMTTAKAKNHSTANATRQTHRQQPLVQFQETIGNRAVGQLLRRHAIQAKLTIGQPGDRFEQEADRVADQVMRMPNPQIVPRTGVAASTAAPHIQRLCPNCEQELHRRPLPIISRITSRPGIQRVCPECEDALQRQGEEEDEELLRRQPEKQEQLRRQATEDDEELIQMDGYRGAAPQVTPTIESSIQSLQGRGRPLSNSLRAFFEPRFGADFSQVRVHSGSTADGVARSINARAFTIGNNIAFAGSQFAPTTSAGNRLLAHELTHVVQQAGGAASVVQLHECRDDEGPPAAVPDPDGAGIHPLVYRGTSQRRSRNPTVGDAQELLNRFLSGLDAGTFSCRSDADMAAIQRIRDSLRQDPLVVDCRFGPNTEKVTKMFQRCVFPGQDDEWDGKIGPTTWPELEALRPAPPTPTPTPCTPPPCPSPPPGHRLRDTGIGALCRGTCGIDCDTDACTGQPDLVLCFVDPSGRCHRTCTYEVVECGSHRGCRDHDACYDRCVAGGETSFCPTGTCHCACDLDCVSAHGPINCPRWATGGGPQPDRLRYSDPPADRVSSGPCPP